MPNGEDEAVDEVDDGTQTLPDGRDGQFRWVSC